jgi:hypothetical protein
MAGMEGLERSVFNKLDNHEKRLIILETDLQNSRRITKYALYYIGTLSTVILGAILVHFGW